MIYNFVLLGSCRSSARDSRGRHNARSRALVKAKCQLDYEVHELNMLIEQLRSSKCWLDDREKKIQGLEILLRADESSCADAGPEEGASTAATSHTPSSAKSSVVSARLRSLEAMQQVRVVVDSVAHTTLRAWSARFARVRLLPTIHVPIFSDIVGLAGIGPGYV